MNFLQILGGLAGAGGAYLQGRRQWKEEREADQRYEQARADRAAEIADRKAERDESRRLMERQALAHLVQGQAGLDPANARAYAERSAGILSGGYTVDPNAPPPVEDIPGAMLGVPLQEQGGPAPARKRGALLGGLPAPGKTPAEMEHERSMQLAQLQAKERSEREARTAEARKQLAEITSARKAGESDQTWLARVSSTYLGAGGDPSLLPQYIAQMRTLGGPGAQGPASGYSPAPAGGSAQGSPLPAGGPGLIPGATPGIRPGPAPWLRPTGQSALDPAIRPPVGASASPEPAGGATVPAPAFFPRGTAAQGRIGLQQQQGAALTTNADANAELKGAQADRVKALTPYEQRLLTAKAADLPARRRLDYYGLKLRQRGLGIQERAQLERERHNSAEETLAQARIDAAAAARDTKLSPEQKLEAEALQDEISALQREMSALDRTAAYAESGLADEDGEPQPDVAGRLYKRAGELGDRIKGLRGQLRGVVGAVVPRAGVPAPSAGSGDVRSQVLAEVRRLETLTGKPATEAQRNEVSRRVRARLGG